MLGSEAEADDAVQEAWLRLSRVDAREIANLPAWLTTVVARVCLDALRARRGPKAAEAIVWIDDDEAASDPESASMLADAIGEALLVVLDTLAPSERLAFVLHDVFDVSFDEIAVIAGKTPAAARQLASRARRRVRGASADDAALATQREVANAFLVAARGGDLEGLVRLLDPDVVVRGDLGAAGTTIRRGAEDAAKGAIAGASATASVRLATIGGAPGYVSFDASGAARALVRFAIAGGRIVEIRVLADPERLRALVVDGE
jgi:RNA polymerase sigma-70 factor (ECF subfamily)